MAMQDFMNHLISKAVNNSQFLKVEKLVLKSEWNPDIAISRDPGSGGSLIAKKIAKKLGWQFFDKKLMLELSQELHIPSSELAHIDEHDRSWFADLLQSIFNPNYVSDVRYISHLKRILNHASKLGDLVILGRGANLILPHDRCLRVRITASRSTRIDNTFKYEHAETREEAALHIEHTENHRNAFIRQYFGVNPHNPWNYDLVVSTDHLTLDQATNIIIQAFLTKFPKERLRLKSKLT